jgi:PleD family two-component response regulator
MNKDDDNNFDSLFKLADLALYQAKENGRNMTVVG